MVQQLYQEASLVSSLVLMDSMFMLLETQQMVACLLDPTLTLLEKNMDLQRMRIVMLVT